MVNFTIQGIGLSTEEARLKPKTALSTTAPELAGKTAGKIFVAIKDFDPNTPNAFSMIFNGKQTKIKDNETFIQTNTATQPATGFKTYAVDIPMRFIDNAKKPITFTIQFELGHIADKKFIPEATSATYTLTITGDDLPTFKPDSD